ncbi:hypothetical protein HPB48_007560 [Haemaphysalis longicornis]|uniref:Secreted protein n=1 Tax=Haemaphysalis longicornis TaxID=44386 RepID=A0A9J6FCL1_HAELO|nr:hypothetical protein HPB48_007560 [Haemaphysalis longicornis]
MGSPFSSLSFLLLIFEFSFFLTGQESSVFTSSVRTPWAARSNDMRDSGKYFPTPRPSPRYQPGASWARHRLRRRGASRPDADRTPPRLPPFISAA